MPKPFSTLLASVSSNMRSTTLMSGCISRASSAMSRLASSSCVQQITARSAFDPGLAQHFALPGVADDHGHIALARQTR